MEGKGMLGHACVLLAVLVAVNCAVRRQIDPVFPGGVLNSTCDTICNEESLAQGTVCGSDGVEYNSACDFFNARCKATKAGENLIILSYGACVTLNTDCDVAIQTICIGQSTSLLLPGVDMVGDSRNELVCGSDHRTYGSVCEFRLAQCRSEQTGINMTLNLVNMGKCKVDTSHAITINCSKYLPVQGNLAIEGGSNFNPRLTCPTVYAPVCSLDGRTLSNECSLCSYMIYTHAMAAGDMITYAAHTGGCLGPDIFG